MVRPAPHKLAHTDANVLGPLKLAQAVDAASAAEPALLVTAVGPLGFDIAEFVHPYRTGFELTRDAVCAVEVARVYESVEPIRGVVGNPHCFGVIAELDQRHHRSECLRLRQLRGVVDVSENRWLDVVTVGQFATDAMSTGEQLAGVRADAVVYCLQYAVDGDRADDGSE